MVQAEQLVWYVCVSKQQLLKEITFALYMSGMICPSSKVKVLTEASEQQEEMSSATAQEADRG